MQTQCYYFCSFIGVCPLCIVIQGKQNNSVLKLNSIEELKISNLSKTVWMTW